MDWGGGPTMFICGFFVKGLDGIWEGGSRCLLNSQRNEEITNINKISIG
jgi:hypothetical protein